MAITREVREFRLDQARAEAPRSLWFAAALIMILSLINVLQEAHGIDTADVMHGVIAVLFAMGAVLTAQPWCPPGAAPWIIAASSVAMVLVLQSEVIADPTALGMAYILMGMLAYGPFTLDVRAMTVAAVPMMLGYLVSARVWAPDEWANWMAAAVAALAFGGALLRIRLHGIDALGAITLEARDHATRDPLAGVLNRRGVEERIPTLVALADRQDESVFAVFVDIDGLKAANDRHGHQLGDRVIRAVSVAVEGTVRAGDLVGRWGGDEFIVVGIGQPLPHEQLAERLRTRLEHSGIDPSLWPGTVSIGSATDDSVGLEFTRLIARADADMYARRRHHREG